MPKAEAVAAAREEADRRVAAAEQRAAEAEARATEAHETAVRLEAEIEERVMKGTADVRREAEERVRKLIEKFERRSAGAGPHARRGADAGGVRPHPPAGRTA